MPDFFDSEKLHFENLEEIQQDVSPEEINQKYRRGEVRIITEQGRYPLSSIVDLMDDGRIKVSPEFQRRFRWNNVQKSKLIESFIMNVPVPPIFLYEDDYSHYEVMDGLQRLTSIYDFYNDRLKLTGLEKWTELNGYTCTQLPSEIRKGIDRRYISSIILLHETAKDESEALRLKQLVFERINSGGVKINPQESRNAVYLGELNRLCIRLSRNQKFCELWNIPKLPSHDQIQKEIEENDLSDEHVTLIENDLYKKMDDVEIVLRFFAFRQRFIGNYWQGTLKAYLDKYLELGNQYPPSVLEDFEALFNRTINLVHQVLGTNAFKLWRVDHEGNGSWRRSATKVIYDPIMYAFSNFVERAEDIIALEDTLKERLKALYALNAEQFEGRQSDKSKLIVRAELYQELLNNLLDGK